MKTYHCQTCGNKLIAYIIVPETYLRYNSQVPLEGRCNKKYYNYGNGHKRWTPVEDKELETFVALFGGKPNNLCYMEGEETDGRN